MRSALTARSAMRSRTGSVMPTAYPMIRSSRRSGRSRTRGGMSVAAWNVTTGSKSIVVGVTDTGIEYTHADLAGNVWSNPGGVNGCPAGTHGYNVLTGTCD